MTAGKILVADDDDLILEIISDALRDAEFDVVTAKNGRQALEILLADPRAFDALVIDRVMPVMDGMAFLAATRENGETSNIPVVMQTSEADSQSMREGIKGGAFYYITKPYDEGTLAAVVRSAVQSHNQFRFFTSYNSVTQEAPETLEMARFRFSTFRQAKSVVWMISQHALEPEWVSAGLQELVANAIEHGNLGIGGQTKELLIRQNLWETEVSKRFSLPENAGKTVVVEFDRTGDQAVVAIEDQGAGFDWMPYLAGDPDLSNKVQGRGILAAKTIAFGSIKYEKDGRRVIVTFPRNQGPQP